LREVVQDGATGLLVPPRDPGALAAALDGLLDDPGRRKRMADAASERARQFGARNAVPRVVDVYEDALRVRRQRSDRHRE